MSVRGKVPVSWPEHQDDRKDRHEDSERCRHASERAPDDVSDERNSNDDRPGRDHCYCHCIEKLPLAQPAVLLYNAPVKEGNDGEAADTTLQSHVRGVEAKLGLGHLGAMARYAVLAEERFDVADVIDRRVRVRDDDDGFPA